MSKRFLGLVHILCLVGYNILAQPCIKPKEPKLFVEGRELPVTPSAIKTYTLNLCTGQTKRMSFNLQESDYKYFIGKSSGERLIDNETFSAGTAASVSVAFDNAVEGTYTVYVYSGPDADGATPPACSSDPISLVIGKSFFGPTIDLDYKGSRDTCINTTIQIKASGSQGSIIWTKNGIPASTSETYTFTLTAATEVSASLISTESCALPKTAGPATINFTVSTPETPSVNIKRSDASVQNCEGEIVYFQRLNEDKPGNYPTYQWFVNGLPQAGKTDPMDFTLENWTNGTKVQLELSRTDGCTSQNKVMSQVIELTGKPKNSAPVNILEIRNSANTNVVCKGTKVILSPVTNVKGLEYVWSEPGFFHPDSIYHTSIDQTAFYKVSAFLSGCATGSDTDSIEIKVADDMQVSIKEKLTGSNEFSICEGDSVKFTSLTGDSESTFTWFKNNQQAGNDSVITLRELASGDVIKVQTASATCTGKAADSLTIRITSRPKSGFLNGNGPVYYCDTLDALLTPVETSNSIPYKWYKNDVPLNITTPAYYASDSGLYKVVIGNGSCTSESTIEAKEFPLSVVPAANPTQFKPGEEISLSAVVNKPAGEVLTFKWEPESIIAQSELQNTTARPLETTTIKLTVKASNGCSASGNITVTKTDTIVVDTSVTNPGDTTAFNPVDTLVIIPVPIQTVLFIPNAFTPATFDQNATWGISGVEHYPELEVKVYNRWGNLVFDDKGYSKPWDGTVNGKDLPSGTYYYLIQDKSFAKPLTGSLTIFR